MGALILDGDRIVLARRGKDPSSGEWSIPGGLVHLERNPAAGGDQRALEETVLEVEPQHLVELLERIFPGQDGRIRYHYVLADFSCKVLGGSLQAGSDASEVTWGRSSELEVFDLAPCHLEGHQKAMGMRETDYEK